MGDIGVVIDSVNILPVNRLLNLMGVHYTGDYVAPTLGTRVVYKDNGLVEFECRLDTVLSDYPVISVNGSRTRVGLMLETPPNDGRRSTALVAIGEKGAYAALNYEFCHQRPPCIRRNGWSIRSLSFARVSA
jgi:hypothetical protein